MTRLEEIDDPATGERVRWHLRSADTGGRLERLELWWPPGGRGGPAVHAGDERFEVLAGRLGFELGGVRREVGGGGTVVVPAGAAHAWWTVGDEPVHFFVELAGSGSCCARETAERR